ncbi:MAG: MoaD/ThiS family protein [Elusimicrobiota bacterium]
MAIKLIFFAQCADWIGRHEMEIEQHKPGPLADLLLSRDELDPILEHRGLLCVAVNEDIADFDTEVKDGDEVAFMPPVSGG